MQIKATSIIAALGLAVLSGFAFTGILGCADVAFPAFDREAHRGGRGIMPENTVEAMVNALNYDITTLEMDVHITADSQVVLSHDEHINPLFSLSPGGMEISREESSKLVLYKMNYADIRQYEVGLKPYSNFPQQKKLKAVMPLLGQVIDSVQQHIKAKGKKQVFYNIETKCSPEGDGIYHPAPETFVRLLMQVIDEKGIAPYVIIQSFDKRTIQIIHSKYPSVRTSYLVSNKKTFGENIAELGYKPFAYSPAYKLVNVQLVNECHAADVKIVPWTVNTKPEIEKLKALGVDGIITDYPNLF